MVHSTRPRLLSDEMTFYVNVLNLFDTLPPLDRSPTVPATTTRYRPATMSLVANSAP